MLVTAGEAARLCHVEPKVIAELIRAKRLLAQPVIGRRTITPSKTGPLRYNIDTDNLVLAGLVIDEQRLAQLQAERLPRPALAGQVHQPVLAPARDTEITELRELIQSLTDRVRYLEDIVLVQAEVGSSVTSGTTAPPLSPPSIPSQPPRSQITKGSAKPRRAPSDYIRVTEFATMHNSVRSTLMGQVNHGKLTTTSFLIEGSRGNRSEQWLSPEQMVAAIAYWARQGTPYQPCGRCP